MSAAVVFAGLQGWYRYGYWSAHFFVDGVQACNTKHGRFDAAKTEPVAPERAELTPEGRPFGKVCARCLKLARAQQEVTLDGR